MNLLEWFRSRWRGKAVKASIANAKALVDGLSDDHITAIVDKVVALKDATDANGRPLPGIEKAARVEKILNDPLINATHGFPSWVREGIDFLSSIVKVAWLIAKLTGRV